MSIVSEGSPNILSFVIINIYLFFFLSERCNDTFSIRRQSQRASCAHQFLLSPQYQMQLRDSVFETCSTDCALPLGPSSMALATWATLYGHFSSSAYTRGTKGVLEFPLSVGDATSRIRHEYDYV